MTRIAYLSADPGVPVFGSKGCSVHVQEVIRAMIAAGAQVDLVATRIGGPVPRGLEKASLVHVELEGAAEGIAAREREAMAASDRMAELLEKGPGYDLVYERYSLWSAAGMEFADRRGVPGVLEVNAPLIEEQAAHRGLVNRAAAEAVAIRAFSSATFLCAVSRGVAEYLEWFGVSRDRIRVVANGVDPARFQPPVAGARKPGVFIVGFVGTLKPWHDLGTLAHGFRKLHAADPSTRLLIVGHGPEREKLVADLARWGISDAVHFTGSVPPDEIPHWLSKMDVGVAPYEGRSAFYFSPLKVLEYMAAGIPTVASRIGDLPDWIVPGESGLLYEPGDSDGLCAALESLRDAPIVRADLGRRARESVERDHSWERVVSRVFREAGVVPSPPPAEVR